MITTLNFISLFLSISWAGPLLAPPPSVPPVVLINGAVHEPTGDFKKRLFDIEIRGYPYLQDGFIQHNLFKKAGTSEISAEENVRVRGREVEIYQVINRSMGFDASVKVDRAKNKLEFTKIYKGKTEHDVEDLEAEPLVVGPTLRLLIESKFKELMGGQTIKFRMAVPFRMETVAFEIKKVGQNRWEGTDWVALKMKPRSIVISALVKPLVFFVSPDGQRIGYFRGRALPRRLENNSFEEFDADMVYFYPEIKSTDGLDSVEPFVTKMRH